MQCRSNRGRVKQRSWTRPRSGSAAFAILIGVISTGYAAPPRERSGVLLSATEDGRLQIVAWQKVPPSGTNGIAVWADAKGEYCELVGGGAATGSAQLLRISDASRMEDGGSDRAWGELLDYSEPVTDVEVIRGTPFITPPANGWILTGLPTIRRNLPDNSQPLAAVTVQLRGGGESTDIPLPAGVDTIRFEQYSGLLPSHWRERLPAGEYDLRSTGGGESTTFFVESAETRDAANVPLARIDALLASRDPALGCQLAVDWLMANRDEFGLDRPYLTEALDRIDDLTAPTPYLQQRREEIRQRLGAETFTQDASGDLTGVTEIDAARRQIEAGRWDAAEALLTPLTNASDQRVQGLAHLYLGVVRGEAALGTELSPTVLGDGYSATTEFELALKLLAAGSAADQHRVHNNHANYLLRRAQDRLQNHAVQAAAGVQAPFLNGLAACAVADSEYQAALQSAPDAASRAAVEVNRARLYALLVDVVDALAPFLADPSRVAEYRAQALEIAEVAAAQALELTATDPSGNGATRAVALELQARLMYRDERVDDCLRQLAAAHDAYTVIGSLAGLESVYRLRGQAQSRAGATHDALDSFLISELIAVSLRDRFPADRAGLSRAGFFARRSHVPQRVVELLLAEGRAAEALDHWEQSKANSLRDLLQTRQLGASLPDFAVSSTANVLATWPHDVSAVEYFLGSTECWLFLIDNSGTVTARRLVDATGEPLAPNELIRRVRILLDEIRGQARKMHWRLSSGQGFDQTWQHTLHEFQQSLLPDDIIEQLRSSQVVVLVPHHILHYFPFAALVTQVDTAPRPPDQLVMPRFLIDEPFSLCHAPSLLVWSQLRSENRPIEQVQAVGIVDFPTAPQLPGVADDLANLKAAFGSRVGEVLFNEAADERTVKLHLARPGLLLFATHGANVADRPLDSRLLLYPDPAEGELPAEDGALTAGEIYAGGVAADCIVMSACFSGLADRSPLPGDDLFGLQRAFLQAGAHSVVAGLWDVYDGTGPLLMHGPLILAAGLSQLTAPGWRRRPLAASVLLGRVLAVR
jgi:hypothetical protein